ncbi:MAG: hypothetical protein DRI57_20650, partial [Deltaproteobacteria bacterium]
LKSALRRTFFNHKGHKGGTKGHKAFGRICLRAGAGASPESVIIRNVQNKYCLLVESCAIFQRIVQVIISRCQKIYGWYLCAGQKNGRGTPLNPL